MNPDLQRLQPYPFEKLRQLFADLEAPASLSPIALSIGEPKHPSPEFVLRALSDNLDKLSNYPLTKGVDALRESIAAWLTRRFQLPGVDPQNQVIPVNGTREALFAFAQAVVTPGPEALVMSPNPFYQIYEGAALLAGAQPRYMNTVEANGFLPDLAAVSAAEWDRCAVLFLCSPGNPTGAVLDEPFLRRAIELADRHDFVIAADECYADIYLHEDHPPPSLLQVCRAMGRDDFHRCIVFHSLSKRSSVPGLRSGFVAGDAEIMGGFRLYRTYHGCAVPLLVQRASVPAWEDEAHVLASRRLYQEKFDAVMPILDGVLDVSPPPAAFYLWAPTPIDDEVFAQQLFATQHVTVLPGRYLSRPTDDGDPGVGRVRISLVAGTAECVEAARRIREFCSTL